ncbi:VOC family protein [Nakamurella endophytica]|uniref:VOC domain-containing protein n=1 Tax=Nakamurella endophytica TaxID=1748367 RepID=A0A917SXM4_9ACTN|nr:VOC family protein [Nakamurella endophytica]GGM02879.1 hypothetical protein GCM10011594_23740 [Nakamurella endophytica]
MVRDPQINLYVADIPAAVAFHRDLLGFTETFRTPVDGPPVHVELRLGALVLCLAHPDNALRMHGLRVGAGGSPRAEVVLWCDGVDADHARLVAAGAPSLGPPHDFLGRLRAAWVADPAGNPVELVQQRHEGH